MHNTPTTNKMGRCMESAFGAADGLPILSRYPPLPAFSPRAYPITSRYLTSVQQQQQQQQFISSDQPNRGPSAFSIPSQRHYATLPTAAPPVASNFIFHTLNSPLRLSPTNATRADDSSSPAPAGIVSSPPIHQTSLVRCVNRCLVDDDGGGKERKRNAKTVQLTALQVTGQVKHLSPALFTLRYLTTLVVANNKLERIPAAIRQLNRLEHLNVAHNQLECLPSEIGDLLALRELIATGNSIREIPFEVGRLFKLTVLDLDENPLSHHAGALLSLTQQPDGVAHLVATLQNSLDVNAVPPPPREWIGVTSGERPPEMSVPVRVLTYNILCPTYCSRNLYGYCPEWALKWNYRVRGLQHELRECGADIICLQEVEVAHYRNLFQPSLGEAGYESVHSPKTRARSMSPFFKEAVDGCAIAWRRSKLRLLDSRLIEFSQLAMTYAEGNANMINRVMTRDNIAQMALLRVRPEWFSERRLRCQLRRQSTTINADSTANADLDDEYSLSDKLGSDDALDGGLVPSERCPLLLVVSVHMHWDPEQTDVKLVQSVMLASEIRKFLFESAGRHLFLKGTEKSDALAAIPVILCGDLNSMPDSGVVKFLREGSIAPHHDELLDIDYTRTLARLSFPSGKMANGQSPKKSLAPPWTASLGGNVEHPLKVRDVYRHAGSPLSFTNYTFDFQGVIDYILASESLHCSGVLGPISTRWLDEQRIVGFPHPHVPSDHVPLLATLHVPMLDALCQKAVTRQRRHESIALAVVPSSVSSKSPGKRNPASVLLDSPIPSGVAPVEPIRPTIGSVASSDADEDGLDSPTDEDDDNDSPLASSEEL